MSDKAVGFNIGLRVMVKGQPEAGVAKIYKVTEEHIHLYVALAGRFRFNKDELELVSG